MENFKSSLVNYLRENSNSKLVHLFFFFFFLNGPGQTKSCPALLFVKIRSFQGCLSFVSFFFFFKDGHERFGGKQNLVIVANHTERKTL